MLSRSFLALRTATALSSSRCRQSALRAPLTYRWASTTVKVPQLAESLTEGTLKSFSKQVGDFVEQDEEIASVETDKIDVSVNAPEAGKITKWLVSEDETVTVGQDLVEIETGVSPEGGAKETAKEELKEPASNEKETASQPEGGQEKEAQKSAPKQEEKKPEPKSQPPPPPEKKSQPPPQPKKDEIPQKDEKGMPLPWNRDERRVKMNRMRLRIAERLKQAQNTAASLSTFQEVDMSALMAFRKKYKDEYLQRTGIKIGFMGAFAHACALAMKELPSVNAGIEGANGGDTIVYHDYVDISVAVSTPKGLTTPVVRNVESMNILDIEKCISELGKKVCRSLPILCYG
jgi:2-oxoglutarate dehydrogenase E2 component (dihydrolipoamide succinyltransferase)